MVRLEEFDIVLPNTLGVYYSGELVHGQVVVQLKEPMKMKGIYIVLHGGARVKWKADGDKFGYSDTETYYHKTATLYGKQKEDDDMETTHKQVVHPPGRFTYPFKFTLPKGIPTSFEGEYGRIRYWVRATIERNMKLDLEAEKVLSVICQLNLNHIADIMLPRDDQDSQASWWFSCNPWKVSARVSLERKGYVCGQYIQVIGEVTNQTEDDLRGHRLELIQRVVYKADGKKHRYQDMTLIDKLEKGKIPPNDSISVNDLFLIPALPPSYLIGCNLIDLQYIIRLVVESSTGDILIALPIEIIIGTRPLRNVFSTFAPTLHSAHNETSVDSGESDIMTMPAIALPGGRQPLPALNGGPGREYPLPSYAECTTGELNETADGAYMKENHNSDDRWVPKYPFYTWQQMSSPEEAESDALTALLAQFQRQKTLNLPVEPPRLSARMPTGLALIPEAELY